MGIPEASSTRFWGLFAVGLELVSSVMYAGKGVIKASEEDVERNTSKVTMMSSSQPVHRS